eukprot:CAMPEP_0206186244 /NCGR_PEP_ID=MMETSP0166-20121206/2296_1 /ASSEMBLY_ACC=CAM_ASM_000260 /TAXON_ID=95228 /ORGANISM="Vannella robusta, Strain DIVA3 518/3/11/1/6" /LENGTH=116 /DNA_ID=CAMNT_0053601609 /DNA_START=72 /DNA_END=422 /DNA_ORIENTATION=+
MAMGGSQVVFVGGFLALLYGFPFQFLVGIYSIILGAVIFPMTYPFEKLQKNGLIHVFQKFNLVGPSLIVASLPCYFSLPTILGAVPLSVSGTFYTVAALRKEKNLNKEQIMKGGRI